MVSLFRFARFSAAFVFAALVAAPLLPARAADKPVFQLVIKDHKFEPDTIEVPAGQKFDLVVQNQDPTPEEFESHALHREKVIHGGKRLTIPLGPLKPGSYPFIGEFHDVKGTIIAK